MKWCSLAVLLLATGCARYEYDIVSPSELRTRIGTKTDAVTPVEPLVYRWRTVDNRLVVRVFNPTEDPIELLGEKSTVVAPTGESHPLQSQTIAPQSHAKLILPPRRPRVCNSGPTFGVGVGMRVDARDRGFPHDHHAFDNRPRYMSVYDDRNALYWDWKGQTEIRLSLVYQRGEETIRHGFVIRRRKV
ncbi:MAG TPA: hypothetical protein VGR35_13235 [Tepidisphaeraceae bacterium]|nr:hypothetical protein [Tepidisphaeraceae bacterium]